MCSVLNFILYVCCWIYVWLYILLLLLLTNISGRDFCLIVWMLFVYWLLVVGCCMVCYVFVSCCCLLCVTSGVWSFSILVWYFNLLLLFLELSDWKDWDNLQWVSWLGYICCWLGYQGVGHVIFVLPFFPTFYWLNWSLFYSLFGSSLALVYYTHSCTLSCIINRWFFLCVFLFVTKS